MNAESIEETREQPDLVAVTGLAGRFPGARNIEEFWRLLSDGECSIQTYSDAQLIEAGHDPQQVRANPDYVVAGGFLGDVDQFDAALFGYQPREAALLDPQHRILLEVSWHALEAAAIDPLRSSASIGVYVGKAKNAYLTRYLLPNRPQTPGSEDLLMVLGNESDYLATAISYRLGLSGPSVNVHTACSTSLVAVHQGRQSLLNYECDVALAGGVCVRLPEGEGYLYNEGNILSSDGITRTFDANAEGTNFSNGAGMVVLKRLHDALQDGDTVYAVLRGSAVNNDGPQRQGYMAPSVNGQAEVISLALADAEVDAADIGYVEAHGTATALGDPIEVAGLSQAFREHTAERQFCALGSVKSNIGHLDAAAGISGLIKTVLSLHQQVLPASLHCAEVNPEFELQSSPFYINRERQDWPEGRSGQRLAGISSFGAGGTNAHVIVQQAPQAEAGTGSRAVQLLLLSARDEAALQQMAMDLSAYLDTHPETALADIAWTLQTGRRELACRTSLCCDSHQDAALRLADPRKLKLTAEAAASPDLVFMFPGQGSQYINMAATLYKQEPVFREAFDQCCRIYRQLQDARSDAISLHDLVFAGQDESAARRLGQTRYTQPALFAVEYALARLCQSWGLRSTAMIGHSVGEYVAAVLAGVFSLDTGLAILNKRAELIQSLDSGSMLAVAAPVEQLEALLPQGLSVCAVNTPADCVLGGPTELIEQFARTLSEQEIESRLLKTSHAFHSSMMEPILAPFSEFIDPAQLSAPAQPFISSFTGTWITDQQATDPQYWAQHIRQAVMFARGMDSLRQRFPDAVYLELGPGNVLTTLARRCPGPGKIYTTLGHVSQQESEMRNLLEALGALWSCGVDIDWEGFYRDETRKRVRLPGYPFQRQSYWYAKTPVLSPADRLPGAQSHTAEQPLPELSLPDQPALQASPVAAGISAVPDRRQNLIAELQSILAQISGLDATELDIDETFIQLGFDSLFLTQASNALRKKFKVGISFRDLLESKPSIVALADYLHETLDPDQFQPEPAVAAVDPVASGAQAITTSGEGMAAGALQQTIKEQLRLISLQVNHLSQALDAAGTTAASAASATQTPSAQPGAVSARAGVQAIGTDKASADESTQHNIDRHGPWRQINQSQGSALSEKNRQGLEQLIGAYTRKSAASREMAQKQRAHFADPRGISGFNRLWKDIVYPLVTERSSGSRMWDIDGNEYLEVQSGFGSVFFGHNMPFIRQALETQLESGMQIGPQSKLAGELARDICQLTGMDRASFCNTGSEAVLAAMRVSRTVTGNDKIVMFAQDYHGIFDEVVARRGGDMQSLNTLAAAPGIPAQALENIVILDFGDPGCFAVLDSIVDDLAAVMIEPVQSRRPDYQPVEFIRELRKWTRENGVVYIFDEVITGFRLHPRGAQGWYDVEADICTYGKVIGGGMPAGVVAGKAQYMDALDGGFWRYGDDSFPETGVTYFAGTFVRHPLTLAAAAAVTRYLRQQGSVLYDELNLKSDQFVQQLNASLRAGGWPVYIQHCGSMMCVEFLCDSQFNPLFFYHLRLHGVHILEAGTFFITTAHSSEELALLSQRFCEAAAWMQQHEFHPAAAVQGASVPPLPAVDSSWAVAAGKVQSAALSGAQQEIWLAVQMGDDASCAYNLSNALTLRGELDRQKLHEAMLTLVNLHDSLKMTVSAEGVPQFASSLEQITLETHDLSNLDATERRQALAGAAEREVQTPFDLETGPLIRFHLFGMDEREHVVFITVHHIAGDGWSCGVLMRQLGMLYSGQQIDRERDVVQIVQYGQWLQQPDQLDRREADRQFWLDIHRSVAPPLELPLDGMRPAVKSFNAGCSVIEAAAGTVQKVNDAARELGVTQYHYLLAVFQTLLFRISQQSDFNIVIPVAGQLQADSTEIVGHCVNLMCLRTQLAGDDGFAATAQNTRNAVLDAFEHAFFNYGELVDALELAHDPSRNALASVVFNADVLDPDIEFAGLELSVRGNGRRFEVFELFLDIAVSGEDLVLNCTFNSDLFEQQTIDRWMSIYLHLLHSIRHDLQGSLASFPLLDESAYRRMVYDWNKTEREFSGVATIPAFLLAQQRQCMDAIAIESECVTSLARPDAAISYSQLQRRSNQLAAYLRAKGVGPGCRIALCLQRCSELPVVLLGILKCGAAYIPLDPDYPAERLRYMLQDSSPRYVLVDTESLPVLDGGEGDAGGALESAAGIINLSNVAGEIDNCPTDEPDLSVAPDSIAYIIYTSGSTGKPKGVCIRHRSVVNFLASMRLLPGLDAGDRLLAVTTLSFDISVLEIFLPLAAAATVVVASKEQAGDGAELLSLIDRQSISCLQATPSTWRMLIESGLSHADTLKALCGGEALSTELASELAGKTRELWNMYGPTETTIWSSLARVQAADEAADINVSIGRPIHNTRFHVLDPGQSPVPIGIAGELYIGGEGLAEGYLDRPELQRQRFVSDPFGAAGGRLYRTGDLVRYRADGSLQYLRRLDDQLKLRGFRIEAGEIETALEQHPDVTQAVLTTVTFSPGDTRLHACYTSVSQAVTAGQLREFLRSSLPEYMVPQYFTRVQSFALTPAGKIDRRELPAPESTGEAAQQRAPEGATQTALAAVWSELLGSPVAGVEQNFFNIGGHSLLAVRLCSAIAREFQVRLNLRQILSNPTIETQSLLIEALQPAVDVADDDREDLML